MPRAILAWNEIRGIDVQEHSAQHARRGAPRVDGLRTALAQQSATPRISLAPAFTAQQLLTPPTDNWITNGGSLYNQRYSPLKLINRDNVAGLKAHWRTGMGLGTSFGNAGQAHNIE
jgi:glucose dehydrogenase